MEEYLKLIEKDIKYLVEVAPISTDVHIEKKQYADARSAAFYAMGKAIKTHESVIVLVSGAFLSNVYTALTEAWFQKVNVIVIALFDKISDVKTVWMERCVVKAMTTTTDDFEEIEKFLQESKRCKGPVLLNLIRGDCLIEKYDYSKVIDMLEKKCGNKSSMYCFNGDIGSVNNIDYKNKYGVLSKYIGMSVVKDCGYLLCTSDCVLVDSNIFRTRYANSNMKIIIFDQGDLNENNIALWIKSNGWDCRVVDSIDENSIDWFVMNNKQSVLIQKED